MPRCFVDERVAAEAAEAMAGLDEASRTRFARLIDLALDAPERDDIRTPLPTIGKTVFLPLHRLQSRLSRPRGTKVRYMLVLSRLPAGDWLLLALVRDSILLSNAVRLAERRRSGS